MAEDKKKTDTFEQLFFLNVFGSFPNQQTPENLGNPGLSYITSTPPTPTPTHSLSVICPITSPLPTASFLSFFLLFFSCFRVFFFSSAHDALWNNEAVKRSPVEGWDQRRVCGRRGARSVRWHYARALYLQCASLTHSLFIAAKSFLSVCHTLVHRHKLGHRMAPVDWHHSAAKGNTPYPLACSCVNPRPLSLSLLSLTLSVPTLNPSLSHSGLGHSLFSIHMVRAQPFLPSSIIGLLTKMKGEKRDLSFCRDLTLLFFF